MTRTIADLDWQLELERRGWESEVTGLARHVAAVYERQHELESLGSLADECRPSGLVSIPTSGRRVGARASIPFSVKAGTQAVQALVGAFTPDPFAGRIARLRCCLGVAARWFQATVDDVECVMVTLTYRDGGTWEPRHVSDFLRCVRRWMAREGAGMRYVWVAELQKRGAIHYHVALWVPRGLRLPYPDEAGWWSQGSTRIELARAASAYLMKYLSKGNDALHPGKLPVGARCHGRGGLGAGAQIVQWLCLPTFIRARACVGETWRRVVGGGWQSPTGERFCSEFARVWAGAWCLQRVADHGRPFEVDGAYIRWSPGVLHAA